FDPSPVPPRLPPPQLRIPARPFPLSQRGVDDVAGEAGSRLALAERGGAQRPGASAPLPLRPAGHTRTRLHHSGSGRLRPMSRVSTATLLTTPPARALHVESTAQP